MVSYITVVNMTNGCLSKSNIENIGIALDVYESEVAEMAKDPDYATSELASEILTDINQARRKLPEMICNI